MWGMTNEFDILDYKFHGFSVVHQKDNEGKYEGGEGC